MAPMVAVEWNPSIVMARVDRLRDLGLDLDGKLVGGQHVEPGAVVALAQRQHRAAAPARWGG